MYPPDLCQAYEKSSLIRGKISRFVHQTALRESLV